MRNVLLLGVVGGLGLFVAQNWSSSALAIMFLGMKTPVLPLAVWILIALIAGFLTSCFLQLFSSLLLSPSPARIRRPAVPRPSRPRPEPAERREWREASDAVPEQEDVTAYSADQDSDWDDEPEEADEWEDWEEEEPAPRTKSYQTVEEKPRDYEVRQEPKSVSRSGSVYSYSYQEPSGSGVGKTEDVYDAEYTLITPPSPEYDPQTNQQKDDWGLEEGEDEFDDEYPDNRRQRPS